MSQRWTIEGIQKIPLQGLLFQECMCPLPTSFYIEISTHPNPYLHRVPSSSYAYFFCLYTACKVLTHMKKIIHREVVKCAHIHLFLFSFGTWIKNEFPWSIIHWEVSLSVFSPVFETQMFPSSEIPTLWRKNKQNSKNKNKQKTSKQTNTSMTLLPKKNQERGEQRKRTLWSRSRSATKTAPGAAGPVGLPAAQPRVGSYAKEQDEFYEPYLLLRQKPKKRRRGGKKINNPLTVWWQNIAKELISTSAKSLENTQAVFSHNPWVLRGRGGIKGTKK